MLEFIEAPKKSYAEVGQAYPVLFAWVRREGNDLIAQHSWVKCRDFLPDAVMLSHRKDYKDKIYGFGIDEKFKPEPYMAIKFPAIAYKQNFYNNLGRIRQIETINKIPNQLKVLYDVGDMLVVEFDPFWMKHPSLISLYTFLFKVFSYRMDEHFDRASANESEYIMATQDCLEKLLANLGKLTYGKFDNGMSLNSFHYGVGFVATYKRTSKHELRDELMRI